MTLSLKRLFACIGTAAAAAALPWAATGAEIQLTPSIGVTETFSDNVDLDRDGQEEEAFSTDVTPAISIRADAARYTSNFDAAVTFRHQTGGDDKGMQILPGLTGFSTVEVSKELFFVDFSSSVSQELLNTRENNTQSNRDMVQTYSLSPYLVSRFGGFADAELRYTFDTTLREGSGDGGDDGDGNAGDSTSNAIRAALNSGEDFRDLLWSVAASASRRSRDGGDDVERKSINLDVEYIVDRSFSALGGAGFQKLDGGDGDDEVDDPTWYAGFAWRPGTRTDLRVTYGQRDNNNTLSADLSYDIGPRTTLVANYRDQLATGQERLAQNLSFIGTDPNTGELIDTRTGLPFDPTTGETSVEDEITRTRTLTVAVRATRGRNSFVVSGNIQRQTEEGDGDGDETAYSVSSSFGRQLSRRTDLTLNGAFSRNEFEEDDRDDNEFNLSTALNYVVFRNINAFTSYRYRKQISTNDDEEFTENSVSVGVRMTF